MKLLRKIKVCFCPSCMDFILYEKGSFERFVSCRCAYKKVILEEES